MRFGLIAVLLVACGRSATPSSNDELWNLAPKHARGAIVISPRGLAMIESGYAVVRAALDRVADLAPVKAQLAEVAAPFGSSVTLADFGFSSTKSAALFLLPEGMVAVLPVVDRDKFLAKVHGTKGDIDTIDSVRCTMREQHYSCATAGVALEALGDGDLKNHLVTRGDIEIVAAELPFGEEPVVVSAAITLARGAGTLRATVTHMPSDFADRFTATASPDVSANTAGFALLDLRPWLPRSDDPIAGAATVAQVLSTLDGMLRVRVPSGASLLDIEQPLTDPAPLQRIVDHCDQLPGGKLENGCRLTVADWAMTFDMWLDGKRLRVGQKPPTVAKPIAMTPIGSELGRGTWSLAFWGRGTMLSGAPMAEPAAALSPENAMVVRAWSLLSELGFAARRRGDQLEIVAHVRTLFANPDDVVSKLLAITADDIATRRAGALAEPIAKASPSAPFARDYAAGYSGLLVPTMLTGAGVTFVIPALVRMRRPAAGSQ